MLRRSSAQRSYSQGRLGIVESFQETHKTRKKLRGRTRSQGAEICTSFPRRHPPRRNNDMYARLLTAKVGVPRLPLWSGAIRLLHKATWGGKGAGDHLGSVIFQGEVLITSPAPHRGQGKLQNSKRRKEVCKCAYKRVILHHHRISVACTGPTATEI